jgi:hypothetical protein
LVKALRKLSKLQSLATLAINGALKISPTDLLDAHAGLLPINLLLKKNCFRLLLYICALPSSNPVSDQLVKYHVKPAKHHRTNLQQLMELFKVNPTVFEVVPAVLRLPVFQLPVDVHIADSKEEAIKQEAKDDASIRIYTNNSCQNGFVGAAAVLYHVQNGVICNPVGILHCQLGPDTKYSIWDAKVAGVIMALWLLRGSNRISCLPISIYSDSQAFLKALKAQCVTT